MDILHNFTKLTEKHLRQCHFSIKVTGLGPENQILAQVFSIEFYKISNNTYFNGTPAVIASA